MTTDVDRFRRTLTNLESMLRRRDLGQLTGRNDASSQATMRARLATLRTFVLESDEVANALDNNDGLAARYNRAERRVLGLPV